MIPFFDRLLVPRGWAILAARTRVGGGVRVTGRIWIHGGGRVLLGDRVELDARRGPIELHVAPGGELVLGEGARVEGGTSIEAVESVLIGEGCRIGAWTKILDNHFHQVDDHMAFPASEPVSLGPGVVVGERCVLLPGARLGGGVRLGHGMVVSRRVPAGTSLEGFPTRPLRSVREESPRRRETGARATPTGRASREARAGEEVPSSARAISSLSSKGAPPQ